MLWVSSDICRFGQFRDTFRSSFSEREFVDLSKVPSCDLMEQCEAIASHQTRSCVFLGYLEPGWMLEPMHQTRIRKLIRTCPVSFVCFYTESIPFAWKNEIESLVVFTGTTENGDASSIDNGGSV
jgi:hypothetical protein